MAVRTRHFDRLFTDAAADGVRQAVILAAGLDARAYRLPWPDGTTVFEVDQPEVIDFKTRTLGRLGCASQRRTGARSPSIFVTTGRRHCWTTASTPAPTAWTAEGLLIYLPSEAQDLLFDRIDELSAPGSRVATEHIPDVSMFSDERSQQISDRLKQYGHDFEMGDLIYHEKRSDVIEYLEGHGWDVSARKMPDAYADNGFRISRGRSHRLLRRHELRERDQALAAPNERCV